MKIKRSGNDDKVELQMTPMIDIVFQLLAFFCMTFRMSVTEGDFNIKMPSAAPREGKPEDQQFPPLKIVMRANDDGGLASVRLGEQSFTNLEELGLHLAHQYAKDDGPNSVKKNTEMEIDCDDHLHYKYAMEAITRASGYATDDGRVVPLFEKIKFTAPKKRS
jgi:biopolymer transport protein ExbD